MDYSGKNNSKRDRQCVMAQTGWKRVVVGMKGSKVRAILSFPRCTREFWGSSAKGIDQSSFARPSIKRPEVNRFLSTPPTMNSNPCLHAQNILTGTAKVEGGFIHGTGVGGSGKEWSLPVVEVLDEVRDAPAHRTFSTEAA